MKYICHFKIWNLNYKVYSDSLEIIRFFKRAYSLFNHEPLRIKMPQKEVLLKVYTGNQKNKQRAILDAEAKIHRAWVENFKNRMLVLHSSSVEIEKKYLLFIGNSLTGKSTMAAMLRDQGAGVLTDDFTPVEYNTGQILRFPTFSNIREGELSNLQKKYLDLLRPCFRRFGGVVRRDYLGDISNQEFKAYYSYNKELYNLKSNVKNNNDKNKKTIAIFLNKEDMYGPPRLKKLDFPQSFKILSNYFLSPLAILKRSPRFIIQTLCDFDCYSLQGASARKKAELILSRFIK